MSEKIKAEQAAALFLAARGRGGENAEEDKVALSLLISQFAEAGYEQAVSDNSVYCPGCSSEAGAVQHMPPICLPTKVEEHIFDYCKDIGGNTEVNTNTLGALVKNCLMILQKNPVKEEGQLTTEEVLKEITQHYSKDEVKPGIQMAWLPEKEGVYTAVHRFPHGLNSRTVVAKAVEPTAEASLSRLLYVWRRIVKDMK